MASSGIDGEKLRLAKRSWNMLASACLWTSSVRAKRAVPLLCWLCHATLGLQSVVSATTSHADASDMGDDTGSSPVPAAAATSAVNAASCSSVTQGRYEALIRAKTSSGED